MDVKKMYVSWDQVNQWVYDIAMDMYSSNFRPNYIVGITRGGLVPATLLSHKTGIHMHTLDVRLRDTGDTAIPESNTWMAEDAFGYNDSSTTGITGTRWDPGLRKKILIIDDINDTGSTLQWIREDWQSSCHPDQQHAWDSVWFNTVKFAALINNDSSEHDINYYGKSINKEEEDVWVVYPWEV